MSTYEVITFVSYKTILTKALAQRQLTGDINLQY